MPEAGHVEADSYLHDAFISYSRKDKSFAMVLDQALRRYVPPSGLPVPRRRLNIFRDEEDFTGTEYYQAVERHLQGSRKLIVICSPQARASAFVNDEIRRFTQVHPPADIIPVLIAGSPEPTSPPDGLEMAFPAALCERLEMPLASDYRGFDPKSDNVRSGRYRTAWYKLLADLCNCSRAEIEKRETRRKLRQRVQWGSAMAVVSAALTVSGLVARKESRAARSNELANQALSVAQSDPARGATLAHEALSQSDTPLAAGALRAALANLPNLQIAVAPEAGVYDPVPVAFGPDERRIAITDKQAGARILDIPSGKTVQELAIAGTPLISPSFSPGGDMLAALDTAGSTTVYDTATGKRIATVEGPLRWLRPVADTGPTASVLRENAVQLVDLRPPGSASVVAEVKPKDYSQPQFDSGPEPSPDGKNLAIATEKGGKAQLDITDLMSGRTTSQTGDFSSTGIVWSPKGTFLVSKWLFGFAVFNTHALRNPFIRDAGDEISVEDVAFSPDEKLLATTNRNGITTLWDVKQRKMAGSFQGPGDRAYAPTFSPD